MTTAREFITLALKEATVLGVGQTPLAEDINDGFTYLKRMLSQWQKRRWLVPALTDIHMPGNGEVSNTIGPGGYWNIQRPSQVKAGYMIQNNTGQTPVSFPLKPVFSYEDYVRITLKELSTFPTYFFYDNKWPKGNVFIWPVPTEMYEIHLLLEAQLVFTGVFDGDITAGAAYTTGTYTDVPLNGGRGEDAESTVIIAGGVVTDVVITNAGRNYVVSDTLTVLAADVGGTGSGFVYTVTELNSNLDYEFELPEEYEEAIHYNLAVRFISGWGVTDPSPQTGKLAILSLNTVKKINSQIPSLRMPRTLTSRYGFSLYNPDGY